MRCTTNRVAHYLLELGLEPGDRINLHLGNCLEFLYLWFGAAKCGIVIMPTNTAASVDELEYLLSHSESRFIFAQPDFADTAETARSRCACVEGVIVCGSEADDGQFAARLAKQPEAPLPGVPGSGDLVAILYTSGTTAKPKGVRVTNANYVYAGETVAKAIRLTPADRHLVVLPLFHGNAQYYSTMSALVTGASIALTARFSASRYFDQAIAHRCTVASLFAAPIRMLLAQAHKAAHRDNRLRVVIFAQSVTRAQLDEWHERFAAPLLQLWGMTETSPYQTVHAPHLIDGFVSQRGEFRLVPLPGNRTRLEGSTWYTLDLFPALYWTPMSDALIHTIHTRVLTHIKHLTEH